MKRIAVVMGTRPEAIKLAPVVRALNGCPGMRAMVVSTGQHREMLDQMMALFGLTPSVSLSVMTQRQELSDLTALLLSRLGDSLRSMQPDAVIVQGDTTTAFSAALAAFYEGIPVGHVEAGLRTGNMRSPWPEEANRALVAPLATWHFCPTPRSARNLVREGIDESQIFVTGNTVIDSLLWALGRPEVPVRPRRRRHRALLTLHRRENQGDTMSGIATTMRGLVADGDLEIVFPVHKNPAVRDTVIPALSQVEGIHLCEPLDYLSLAHTLESSDLVLTDSGGLQEEAPTLGKPVLVLRDTTERPEAVEAGVAKLVGTDPGEIFRETRRLLDDEEAYRAMATPANPFGDGHASERIAALMGEPVAADAVVS